MKYYIAADGGGTKFDVILFDEDYNVLRRLKSGGINENFKSVEIIEKETDFLVKNLLEGYGIREIECVNISAAGKNDVFLKRLSENVKVNGAVRYNEGETVLYAAGLKYGVVAQAGTGSDVFVLQPDERNVYGGLGSLLGDEGSGFYIGQQGLKAAVKAFYGSGKQTILKERIFDELKVSVPEDIRRGLAVDPLVREKTASLSKSVAKAAVNGDFVAKRIFKNAGKELAELTIYALKKRNGKITGSVIASGGAWKGCRNMFDAFYSSVTAEFPSVKPILAEFEPIAGLIFVTAMENGCSYEKVKEKIVAENPDLRFFAKGLL